MLYIDAANSKSYPGTGSTWSDISKNSRSGTLYNAPEFSSNTQGYFSFNGTDNYLLIDNTSYPSAVTDNFSMEMWFRIPAAATWSDGVYIGSVFTRGTYFGSHGFVRNVSNNSFGFWVRGDSGLGSADTTLSRDTWYQAVGTWDGSTARLYINGALASSAAIGLTGNFESTIWYVSSIQGMAGANGNRFQGDISNLKIYSRVITADEVLLNFNSARGRYGI